jgi:shikimate kinase
MVITLIGYRGTGKSTVAPPLAKRLGWDDWVDADALIEQQAGRSIREIFVSGGEPIFRALERDVMRSVLQLDRAVIAAGGGAILNEQTRHQMATAGPVVWLMASVATILGRIEADASTQQRRPDLTAAGGRAEIEHLLAVREPLYRQCADITVATDELTTDQIIEQILAGLPPQLQEGAAG